MAELDKEDLLAIFQTICGLLRFVGLSMLVPAIVSFYYNESVFVNVFLSMAFFLIIFSTIVYYLLGKRKVYLKHAIISIAISWFVIGLVSAIPFLFVGMSPVDSFFESVSGWSGTGLSMIPLPEQLPQALNFWRGYIQWLGGFGIVILALLFFEKPETARNLFLAEGRAEDFYPNVFKIARTIVAIYFLYTFIGIILLLLSGLSFFDAVIHSFTSIATGGFSTNSIGIGFFGPSAMAISIILMVLGGISFESHLDLLRGKIKAFVSNPEVRFFFAVIFIAACLVFLDSFLLKNFSFFDEFFYVVSALSGTGATSIVAVNSLPNLTVFVLVLLMVFGSCYGSTTGAIKLWRILILFKVIRREIHRAFLPAKAIVPIKIGNKIISDDAALKSLSYMALYVFFLVIGSIVFMFSGFGVIDSIFTVASAQGNVGLSTVSGLAWFEMNSALKILLSLHMIVGRMEIIPFLIVLRSFRIVKTA